MRPARGILLALLFCWRAAHAITELGDGLFTLDGSLRTTSVATQNYQQPLVWGRDNAADGQTDMSLRLVASGRQRAVLGWEVHVVQRLTLNTAASAALGSAPATSNPLLASATTVPYRALDTRWEWARAGDVNAWAYLDRASAKLACDFADITIGRQAITFGKAYFWNPLDVFVPFGSTQFDRDYKSGVDAVRVDAPLGDFSGVSLVAVPGLAETVVTSTATADRDLWYRSALLARAFANIGEWDVAAQAGKILGGHQFGGGAVGELGVVQVRAEAVWFVTQDNSSSGGFSTAPAVADHLSAVAGIGRSLAQGDVQLQTEYFYNGAARGLRRERFALVATGRLMHVNRHVVGTVATYRLHHLLNGSLALLWGAEDTSWLLQPGFVYSAAAEVDVVAGAIVAGGRRPRGTAIADFGFRSEFGTYPNFYYIETKAFF